MQVLEGIMNKSCCLICGFSNSWPVLNTFAYNFCFQVPKVSDSSQATLDSQGEQMQNPDCSSEALLSITHLRCAFLGENKTVHMSHSHHVQNRAPGVAQRTSDQRSEVESQEVQVILRRWSVALKRNRKLQQTHPEATLQFLSGSK